MLDISLMDSQENSENVKIQKCYIQQFLQFRILHKGR